MRAGGLLASGAPNPTTSTTTPGAGPLPWRLTNEPQNPGRLQNKTDLMAGLEKVSRVLKKLDEGAPHDCVLVLDASVGQNAHSQVKIFRDMVAVSGLVVTKLDGSAKGGVIVALAERFGLPVHAIGVGEGAEDLQPFNAKDYSRDLMGLEA